MLLNKEKIFEKVINLIDTKGFNCKKIKEFSSNESQQLENLILFLNNQKSTNNIAVLLNTDTCSLSFLSTPIPITAIYLSISL